MNKLTMKEAKSILKALGVTLTCKDGEYRVNIVGGSESTAYYTNDLEDAYLTGIRMATDK